MRLVGRLSNTVDWEHPMKNQRKLPQMILKPARHKSVVNGEEALRRYMK